MAEHDPSELDLRAAFRAYLEDAPTDVRPVDLTHQLATANPHQKGVLGRWGLGLTPALAWTLLLAGLLLALVTGGLVAGGWRPDLGFVIAPSSTPAATVVVVDDATDILATTRAKPLPAQATCPPGSNPDAPGSADQDRPTGGEMAFDRHAGRIVLLEGTQTWTFDVCTNTWQRMSPAKGPTGSVRLVYDTDSDRTLAFTDYDESSPTEPTAAPSAAPATERPSVAPEAGNPSGGSTGAVPAVAAMYQGEPDRQSRGPSADVTTRVVWSYDFAADRWTRVGSLPWVESDAANPTYGTLFYHDPSGLVVLYDGAAMWAYDVDTNTLAKVRQRPDPVTGAVPTEDKLAFGYDPRNDLVVAVAVSFAGVPADSSRSVPALPGMYQVPQSEQGETWTFDPGTGTWRLEASPARSDLIVCGYWAASRDCYPTNGRAVFDEASGLPVFFNRDNGGAASALATPGRIDGYDAGAGAWRTLRTPTGAGSPTPNWCESMPPVYDSLNRRIVCLSSAGEPIGVGVTYPYAGVWAFTTTTGESRWLLQPDSTRCDVSTLAGKPGEAGAANGTGAAARLSEPRSIVMDSAGALYITDTGNHAIRKMTADGTVTTFAGRLGEPGFTDGLGVAARFNHPGGIAIDEAGVLYVADTANDAIRRIDPDGTVTTLVQGLGISPVGVAVNSGGWVGYPPSVYAGGSEGNVILQIAFDGTVTTLAGERDRAGSTDGTGLAARFESPIDVEFAGWGDLYVIDVASRGDRTELRMVSPSGSFPYGTVSTLQGDWDSYGRPGAVWADPSGSLDISSPLDNTILETAMGGGSVTLLAGRPGEAGYQDGRRDAARFRGPTDIVRAASGMFYIVDSGNSVIRTMVCTP